MTGVSRCGEVVTERKVGHARRRRPVFHVKPADAHLGLLIAAAKRWHHLVISTHHSHRAYLDELAEVQEYRRIVWENPHRALRVMRQALQLLRSPTARVRIDAPPELLDEAAAVLEAELPTWGLTLPRAPQPVRVADHVVCRWRRDRRASLWDAA